MDKREIRRTIRAARRAVPAADKARHDAQIAVELLARPDVSAAIASRAPICVYLAVADEIDLSRFISEARSRGAILAAPRWNGSSYSLSRLEGPFRQGPHDIPEPAADIPVAPADVALWIVPGLAFTVSGGRLGYGGGWYDRFFASADPAAPRIGVAYPFQIFSTLPSEPHDIPITDLVAAPDDHAIGFFDSGVGGLSVWRAVAELLPDESTDYISDAANCPYGGRSREEILFLARRHVRTLLARGAKLVVVACNTATAAAVDDLRAEWPDVPFVGLEPAVKPAALRSKTGVVGVLATKGTFQGRLYRETSARYAAGARVVTRVADDFVSLVERGVLDGPEVEEAVRAHITPLLESGVDQIVLGCTHFPFLKPVIERVAAGRASVIDPSAAVALQVKRVLTARGALKSPDAPPKRLFETTGDPASFTAFLNAQFPPALNS